MLRYIFKVLVWYFTPKSRRGQFPKRPLFDLTRTLVAVMVVGVLFSSVVAYRERVRVYDGNLDLNTFWELVEAQEVISVDFSSKPVVKVYTEDAVYSLVHPDYLGFRKEIMERGIPVRYVVSTPVEAFVATLAEVAALSIVLIIGVVIMRTVLQNNELKAVRASNIPVTFDDVRGMTETKKEVMFAVEQLRNRAVLKALGARPVRGILFEGPPGTGKTLLAKAIAGEAGVPLISASGSDFIEMFVGVGAARIRKLWQQAEDSAPCVLFIDEIDAVGRNRGSNAQNIESNQTINALLQRMDGLGTRTDILVIGATNRKEDLDPALLRPGRFDRTIYVGPPRTLEDRMDICELYLSKLNVAPDVTPEKVAKLTVGMTGADIEQCLNDAALLVARQARDLAEAGEHIKSDAVLRRIITLKHIDEAITRHLLGGVATGHINERDRRTAAIHEAGHTVVCLDSGLDVLKVSITPYTTGAGGLTQSDEEATNFLYEEELRGRIRFLLGGLAAEEVLTGHHTTGVADDLNKASNLALQCVTCFGTVGLFNEEAVRDRAGYRGISDAVYAKAEELLQQEAQKAREVCLRHRQFLEGLVQRLLEDTTVLNLVPSDLKVPAQVVPLRDTDVSNLSQP